MLNFVELPMGNIVSYSRAVYYHSNRSRLDTRNVSNRRPTGCPSPSTSSGTLFFSDALSWIGLCCAVLCYTEFNCIRSDSRYTISQKHMGRPSRKRARPRPSSEKPTAVPPCLSTPRLTNTASVRFDVFSLPSLVYRSVDHANSECKSTPTTTPSQTVAAVHNVWGAVSNADIAAAPGLRSGDVEVDSSGVAWLLNTRLRSGTTTTPAQSFVACEAEQMKQTVQAKQTDRRLLSVDDGSLQANLQRMKLEFDDIPPTIFKRVRSACNPAEALGSGPFLNRSAMKLANIDAIAQLTTLRQAAAEDPPRANQDQSASASNHDLLFADLCGGPGGFSEYLLRRTRHLGMSAKGWGISLREQEFRDTTGGGGGAGGGGFCDADGGNNGDTGVHGCVRNGRRTRGRPVREETVAGEGVQKGEVDHGDKLVAGEAKAGVAIVDNGPCTWRLDRLSPWCNTLAAEGNTPIFSEDETSTLVESSAVTHASVLLRATDDDGGSIETGGMKNNQHVRASTDDGIPTGQRGVDNDCAHDRTLVSLGVDVAPLPAIRQPPVSHEMRIEYGRDGTGDLTHEANIYGFVNKVLASTGGKHLGLVVADGGFHAARDASEQEHLTSPLVHCEVSSQCGQRPGLSLTNTRKGECLLLRFHQLYFFTHA